MAARYCTACGNSLGEADAFCSNCGRSVYGTAHVDTSQTNVQIPSPPHPQQYGNYPQQVGSSVTGAGRVRTGYYWLAFAIFAVLALAAGDNGTGVSFIGVLIAAIWVHQDARSRGMEGATLWAVGVFLLFIVFFPLYFFKRRPRI